MQSISDFGFILVDLPGFKRSHSRLSSRVSKPCKLEEKVSSIEMLASCYGVMVRRWHFQNASPSPNIFIAYLT